MINNVGGPFSPQIDLGHKLTSKRQVQDTHSDTGSFRLPWEHKAVQR